MIDDQGGGQDKRAPDNERAEVEKAGANAGADLGSGPTIHVGPLTSSNY